MSHTYTKNGQAWVYPGTIKNSRGMFQQTCVPYAESYKKSGQLLKIITCTVKKISNY